MSNRFRYGQQPAFFMEKRKGQPVISHHPNRAHRPGNSITEYAVVGCGVLLAAIGALYLTGGNLDSLVGLLRSNMDHHVQMADVANTKQLAAKAAFQAPPVSTVKPVTSGPMTANMQIRLPDGTVLNMAAPTDIPQSIQTVGTNGTTEMLATTLEGIAKQLLDEGKIPPSGSNAIMTLANLAHRQADISNIIETTMKTCHCDSNAALDTTVQYQGQNYKLSDLAGLISTGSANADGSYNYGSQSAQFWSAYTNLWSAGAMKDPATSALIDTYVHEIANLSDSNRVILYKMGTGYGGTPDEYQQSEAQYMQSIGYGSTATLLQSKTGAAVTNLDSAAVCTTKAGNQDSGTHCSQ